MTTRATNSTDIVIGRNIRSHRERWTMTQAELAGQLGITFQQLQKYENAINRVPASRLYEIGRVLRISIMQFFVE